MTTQLKKRLHALEALPPKVDQEQDRRMCEAIDAILASVSFRNEWAPSKVAPFHWVPQPSDMDLLADRVKRGVMTEADRALLDSWPKCHIEPAEMVEVMATAWDKF
jgi:hypothetical protein